jgi:hypothetical protein
MKLIQNKMNNRIGVKTKLKNDKRIYVKKFHIPIYDREFRIIVCDNIEDGFDFISYKGFDGEDDWVEATVIEDLNGIINLIIKPDATINTICHESLHVVTAILSNAGLELCEKSEEAYAYLIGFIAERIEMAIIGYNKNNPK